MKDRSDWCGRKPRNRSSAGTWELISPLQRETGDPSDREAVSQSGRQGIQHLREGST